MDRAIRRNQAKRFVARWPGDEEFVDNGADAAAGPLIRRRLWIQPSHPSNTFVADRPSQLVAIRGSAGLLRPVFMPEDEEEDDDMDSEMGMPIMDDDMDITDYGDDTVTEIWRPPWYHQWPFMMIPPDPPAPYQVPQFCGSSVPRKCRACAAAERLAFDEWLEAQIE